jgi:hypothetical protein
MRTKCDVILITLLLIVSANAQKQEISGLKTQTITLSRKAPKDKTAPPRFWILVDSDGRQVKPVEFKGPPSRIDKTPSADVIDASSSAMNVGQVQVVNLPKRRYSIAYVAFSPTPDDLWLHVEAAPVGGMGLLKDMGEMKWEEVDRMPALVLKPITPGISFSINYGMRSVGPQGLIVRALAGHVYAAEIKDDRTDYRVIFRIDSIDSNGDCNISWKRIPAKWAAWAPPTQPNKSLDASGGSVFRIMTGPAKVE